MRSLVIVAGATVLLVCAGAWIIGPAVYTLLSQQVQQGQPATANQVPACPQARDLGPWAPTNGVGETFEVTANETVSGGVHVQLWWPGGTDQPWGTKEISVLVPSGLSIEVQKGAGRGWEYALGCSTDEIEKQIQADGARRKTDTSFFGRVSVDDVVKAGLAKVRFDRRK